MPLVSLFGRELKVINVGLPLFARDLKKAGVACQNVDWRPRAGGNPRVLALLDRIRKSEGKES